MQAERYRNITISGGVGTGTSTLFELLKKEPGFHDWEFFSGGEFMRAYAQENGLFAKGTRIHHDATTYGEEFDRKVDFGMRERLMTKGNQVFEGWLAGFFAQRVPGALKVLLTCSEMAVRVDRIVNRDGVSVEEAKEHVRKREHDNFTKWGRMYAREWQELVGTGPIDFWDARLYDLVIDTYSHSKEETLRLVLEQVAQ